MDPEGSLGHLSLHLARSSPHVTAPQGVPCCPAQREGAQHGRDAATQKHHLEQQEPRGTQWMSHGLCGPVFPALAPPGERRAVGKRQQETGRTLQGASGAWIFFII